MKYSTRLLERFFQVSVELRQYLLCAIIKGRFLHALNNVGHIEGFAAARNAPDAFVCPWFGSFDDSPTAFSWHGEILKRGNSKCMILAPRKQNIHRVVSIRIIDAEKPITHQKVLDGVMWGKSCTQGFCLSMKILT